MRNLSYAVIIEGMGYSITKEEAKKIQEVLNLSSGKKVNTTTVKPLPEKPVAAEDKPAKKSVSKKAVRVVGSIEQNGTLVRTVAGKYINSKARYAIKMNAEAMGAIKLSKDDKVYQQLAKEDKYVQVYKFKSEADATKFMDAQETYLAAAKASK